MGLDLSAGLLRVVQREADDASRGLRLLVHVGHVGDGGGDVGLVNGGLEEDPERLDLA